jgi:hypothetical protein
VIVDAIEHSTDRIHAAIVHHAHRFSSSTPPRFANYALYRVGKNATSYARDFFDVSSTDLTTGLPASNGAYATLPGWDYVTGFGTPKVSGLICDLDGAC